MQSNFSVPNFIPDAFRIPNSLVKHSREWGMWDGVCHIESEGDGGSENPLDPEPEGGEAEAETVKDPNKLLKAYRAEKEASKKLSDRIAGLEAKLKVFATIDPNQYEALQEEAKRAEELESTLNKRIVELNAKHKENISSLEQRYQSVIQAEKDINTSTVKRFLMTQEYVKFGKPELVDLFIAGYGDRFSLEFDGDRATMTNARLVAMDSQGKPEYVKRSDTNQSVEMGIGDFLIEKAEEDKSIGLFLPSPSSQGTGTISNGMGSRNYGGGEVPKNASEAFANLPTTV